MSSRIRSQALKSKVMSAHDAAALIPPGSTVGMSGFAYRRFIAWTAPACAVWALAYVGVGSLAAGTYRELSDRLHYAGYIFAGIIVVFLVGAFAAKRLIFRGEARHMEHRGDDGPAGDGGSAGDGVGD